jgi:hypothetical protein
MHALRSDLVLVTIDRIMGETSFLPSALPNDLSQYSQGIFFVTFSDGVVVVALADCGQTF